MMCQDAQHLRSYSRRASRRIAGYVTAGATQKTDEKASRLVCHLTEIALIVVSIDIDPCGERVGNLRRPYFADAVQQRSHWAT